MLIAVIFRAVQKKKKKKKKNGRKSSLSYVVVFKAFE
ncbi:hypothetical protein QG37_04131 [Candidozyma auris]|uniref:Uncharacterized protein n=1 Tax=Candidozyma auris TaxID=498019 RepID=A0A0L0NYM1_CANAR|nr:hypothetical protein QG37_04131 [[Candida] auris]